MTSYVLLIQVRDVTCVRGAHSCGDLIVMRGSSEVFTLVGVDNAD